MGSSNFKAIDNWIEEKSKHLPMPENELYCEFMKISCNILGKQAMESKIDELNKIYWSKLSLLNFIKIAEIPYKTLIDIKTIANSEESISLEALFEIIDSFFQRTELEIESFLQAFITYSEKERMLINEAKIEEMKHLKEFIYNILLVSSNNGVKSFMEKFLSEKEKVIVKYQSFLDKTAQDRVAIFNNLLESGDNPGDNVDMLQIFSDKFKEIWKRDFPIISKGVYEYLEEILNKSLTESLKVCLEKECQTYSKSKINSIILYNYYTNEEIRKLTMLWMQDFENIIKIYGLIPDQIRKDIRINLYEVIRENWRETIASINPSLNYELFNFTKDVIIKLAIGSIKLFDPFYCKQLDLIKQVLMKSISNAEDHSICLELISELSRYFENQDYYHPEESESVLSQNFLENSLKEERYFFLVCIVLVTSMQHYTICPDWQQLPRRESDSRHFSWLLSIVNTSFELDKCIPNLRRFDDPMLLCQVIMRAVKEELKNMGIEQLINNSHEVFLQMLNDHIKSSFLRNEGLWMMKATPSEEITITVSGYTSQNYENLKGNFNQQLAKHIAEDAEEESWEHLLNLPNQGTTYNYAWESCTAPEAISTFLNSPLGHLLSVKFVGKLISLFCPNIIIDKLIYKKLMEASALPYRWQDIYVYQSVVFSGVESQLLFCSLKAIDEIISSLYNSLNLKGFK